jgi:hypothetical protein
VQPPLLLVTDPDWAKAQANDPEWVLRSVGETIRSYCGWHIAPSITEVLTKLEIGSNGILMLPSLYVTDVAEVLFYQYRDAPYYPSPPYSEPVNPPYSDVRGTVLDPRGYRWFENGYIEPAGAPYVSSWGYLPNTTGGYASVTLTHGYESVPEDIKQVAYELAAATIALGGGDSGSGGGIGMLPGGIKTIASPGFSLTLGGSGSGSADGSNMGMNLNADQKARLANYRIGGVR